MEGTIKPPLITPSISPPPPPPPSFFPLPFKISDAAPPAKRRRISSANRQLQPTSQSSLNFDDPVYFEKAREDSAFRLWDAWSQLEDRYARGLDEDDIIDLEAQEIVKDRGVIRGVKKQWKFGCLVEGEGEEEEDTDDLDAISDKSSGEEGNPLAERFRHVPPVTEMDPADAEDLKRFLEAERRRKESCPGGAEDSEESEHERVPLAQNLDHDSQLPSDPTRVEAPGQESPTRNASPGKRAQQLRHEKGAKSTTPDDNPPYYVDSGSDDELEVNWKLDEASVVYRVRKVEDSDDSDIEVIGPPTKILSGSGIPEPNFPRHPQTQLHTPPQSQVSLSSATPSDDIFSTFQSSSLPPSSPPPSSPPPSSPLPSSTLPSPTKPLSIVRSRLQYPMLSRSSPSSHASTSRTQVAPIPRLDLSKLKSKANPSSSKPKTPNNRERDRGVLPSITGSAPDMSSYHRAKSMTVEVVLDRRPTPKSSPPRVSSSVKSAITKTPAKKRPKSQNREHKTNPQPALTDVEDQLGESDGSLTIRSPLCSPQKLAPIPLKTAAPRAGARNMALSGPSRLPEPPPPSRANKRKRAISISSSGSEREEAPGQPLLARPVFLRPRKRDDVCESEDTSGYTSEVETYREPSRRAKSRPRSRHRSPDRRHRRSQVAPLPRPQAEFIISQVVHQLSALFGDTNKHHRRSNSVHHTPSHRPHSHPQSSDPGFSIATSPPASPEPSSPVSGTERRKSLVSRSQSRGRRVSFKLDRPDPGGSSVEENTEDTSLQSNLHPTGKTPQSKTHQLTKQTHRNGEQNDSAEASGSLDTQPTNRGRKATRGQTPGPPITRKKRGP